MSSDRWVDIEKRGDLFRLNVCEKEVLVGVNERGEIFTNSGWGIIFSSTEEAKCFAEKRLAYIIAEEICEGIIWSSSLR